MSRWISDEPLKMVLGAAVEVFGNDQQHGLREIAAISLDNFT